MAEMKLSTVLVVGVVVVAVGLVGAALMDWVSIGPLNRKTLLGWLDKGTATVSGFTPAKTPQEAMDKFREAIEQRKYKTAEMYVTKDYAAMLERSAVGAEKVGTAIDRIQEYAENKGTATDKVRTLFHLLDPFPPKMLKSGVPPEKKGDKYYGKYNIEGPNIVTMTPEKLMNELGNVDFRMYQRVLAPGLIFGNPIEIVKEGEDWKLNIPVNPAWQQEVAYFNDHWMRYHKELDDFKGWMLNNNNLISTQQGMETEIIEALRKLRKTS